MLLPPEESTPPPSGDIVERSFSSPVNPSVARRSDASIALHVDADRQIFRLKCEPVTSTSRHTRCSLLATASSETSPGLADCLVEAVLQAVARSVTPIIPTSAGWMFAAWCITCFKIRNTFICFSPFHNVYYQVHIKSKTIWPGFFMCLKCICSVSLM